MLIPNLIWVDFTAYGLFQEHTLSAAIQILSSLKPSLQVICGLSPFNVSIAPFSNTIFEDVQQLPLSKLSGPTRDSNRE